MKQTRYKRIAVLLVLILLLACTACSAGSETVRIGFLKGPTGLGAAYMIDNIAKEQYDTEYQVTLESDASVIAGELVAGELDIAALPTNAAAALYQKTNGQIQIAAINTLGVLYILENGDTVHAVSDLKGKTIYATGQGSNPEYVLNHILRENGLEPGVDVTVTYLVSDELTTKMINGDCDICMLPVPAATTVCMKNKAVRTALDLTAEWDLIHADGSVLTQGCIAIRKDALQDKTIKQFLEDYAESIAFMTDSGNIDTASQLAEDTGIVGSAAVAKAAIPQCNIVYIHGADTMQNCLQTYYEILFQADPTSIGGAIPDEAFYDSAK